MKSPRGPQMNDWEVGHKKLERFALLPTPRLAYDHRVVLSPRWNRRNVDLQGGSI